MLKLFKSKAHEYKYNCTHAKNCLHTDFESVARVHRDNRGHTVTGL